MQVKVPAEVAEAFDYHKNQWKSMSEDSINLMFMAITCSNVHGKALILKNFAQKKPTVYLQAIANGYIAERDVEKELAEMITMWMEKPYVGDEQRDINEFARMVINYFQHQK